ncbi:Para-hydroxybenzoate--polyprenyltransferase, mitochondrial precursor (PHB:polyprenyltransferase) [Xylographa pallens]|nr:Para-hydroxybenzoate--polyprenyltransferase, mitochondrial precursor (PHB:polyprenyltransferase) [Xylographa pallens]
MSCQIPLKTPLETPLPSYEPPQNGILSRLPHVCIPYAELMRIDKPVAFLYLYFPCIFGTLLAAILSDPVIPLPRLLQINLILVLGCFLVRCAGCTWNDIVDQDIDRQVSRTRNRPLARQAISTPAALTFTLVQVLLGLGLVWLLLPLPCLYYSVPSMILTGLYPFAKRFTYYPQLVLGCVFSWGVILAFPAFDIDLYSNPQAMKAALSLYFSCIAWTMSYDTIYAAQDIKDDLRAAVKSPVVRHRGHTRRLLFGAILTQLALLPYTGVVMEATGIYFLGTCVGAGVILGREVSSVDLADPKDCLWWFNNGCLYTGVVISSGFGGEYLARIGWISVPPLGRMW